MMKIVIPLLLMALSGCAAELVAVRGKSTSQYAPSNEKKGGIVRYRLNDTATNKRIMRDNAYKKMYQVCDGPYKIVSETQGHQGTGGLIIPTGGMAINTAGSIPYNYIDFKCEDTESVVESDKSVKPTVPQ